VCFYVCNLLIFNPRYEHSKSPLSYHRHPSGGMVAHLVVAFHFYKKNSAECLLAWCGHAASHPAEFFLGLARFADKGEG
jgi:hypothetical protein